MAETTMQQDIEEMTRLADLLRALLRNPEPGLFTWASAVGSTIKKLNDIREGKGGSRG